jgi:hypothetical protein
MNIKRISMLSSTLLVAILAGCNNTVAPPKESRADPCRPQQVHVDSESLRRDTAVGPAIVARDSAGLLHVTLPIRSAIDKELHVDYWVSFFDEQRNRISKLGPFTKHLQAHTPDSIDFTSTSPRAADFQVDLRYAQ